MYSFIKLELTSQPLEHLYDLKEILSMILLPSLIIAFIIYEWTYFL